MSNVNVHDRIIVTNLIGLRKVKFTFVFSFLPELNLLFFVVTVRTFSEEWPSSGESKNDDDERSSQAPSRSPKEKDSGKDKERDLESKF